MTTTRTALGTVIMSVATALLTACAGAPAAPSAAPAAPTKDTAAACAAQVRFEGVIPPGIDPSGPPASGPEIQAWAATVGPDFAIVQNNTPDTLRESVAELESVLDTAKQGTPIDFFDPATTTASNTLDSWAYDSCGYQTLDVVNNGGAFGTLPATVQPGPVVLRFSNTGDSSKAGFVLLLARVKDGQSVTVDDLNSGRAELEQVADVVAGAQPVGAAPAFVTSSVTSGRYILTSPLGAPPAFTGSIAAELTVP